MTTLRSRSRELIRPAFAIGLRGYDRAQVDEYIEQLQRLVADADRRARDAAAEYVFDEHASVGPRIAEIFALAETEARATVDAAERAAGEIRERGEREHVVMFAELEQERERIRGEVAVLERRKAEAVGELHRLREVLGEAAGVPGAVIEAGGRAGISAQLTGGSDKTMELPAVTADLDD